MPLVDYGSSGESGDEENETEEVKSEEKPQVQPQTTYTVKVEQSTDDDPTIFSSLPKPSKQITIYGNVDSLQNLLLNNKTSKSDGTNKKGHVKISIPSLSDFENDSPKPEPKKIKSSTKQAGLFSVLPPPKNVLVKETKCQLIPHVLKNQMSKPKCETFVNNDTKTANKVVTQVNNAVVEDDDDDNNAVTSYFGEGISNPLPKLTVDYTGESSSMPSTVENNVQYVQASNSATDQMTGYYPEHYYPTEASMVGQVAEHETAPANNEPLELDDKALQILCGGKRKRNQIPVNIIDLSGEEIMPDSKQWLLKQLSEEQKTRTPSHKKTGGPSVTSRRKHQITYLAFQAKAQELELQNQWSNNRMSRRQTQSKYGF